MNPYRGGRCRGLEACQVSPGSSQCTSLIARQELTQADLVHDGDASLLGLGVKLLHGGGDIAGGDDMLLVADGRLDDGGVVGVGDQADGQVVLGDGGIESSRVVDVDGDRVGIGNALGELLGGLEGSASWARGEASMLAMHDCV